MNAITRRIAAATALLAAPALIALGTAGMSHAETASATTAPPPAPRSTTRPSRTRATPPSPAPPSTTATRTTAKPPNTLRAWMPPHPGSQAFRDVTEYFRWHQRAKRIAQCA